MSAATLGQLQPFPTTVVIVDQEHEVELPANKPYMPDYPNTTMELGAIGASMFELMHYLNSGIPPSLYKQDQDTFNKGLALAGRLTFKEKMLADEQAVIAGSGWLSHAQRRMLDEKDFNLRELSKRFSTPVIVALGEDTKISLDGSHFVIAIPVIIYTRYQDGEIHLYKEHTFEVDTDSPITPVSVWQKDKKQWTQIKPVSLHAYVQNWFADSGAEVKKVFARVEPQLIAGLRHYLSESTNHD